MAVYFLQFAEPIGTAKHKAQFYIGWTSDRNLDRRIEDHKAGRGSAITKAVVALGIQIEHVLTLPGGRTEERRLKNQKNTKRIVKKHLGYIPNLLPL